MNQKQKPKNFAYLTTVISLFYRNNILGIQDSRYYFDMKQYRFNIENDCDVNSYNLTLL